MENCIVCGAPGHPAKFDSRVILCDACDDDPVLDSEIHDTPSMEDAPDPIYDTESDVPQWNDTMHKWASASEDDILEARHTAYDWHGGQWSPLYAFASSGIVESKAALEGEVNDCLDAVHKNPEQYSEDDYYNLIQLLEVVQSLPEDPEEDEDLTPKIASTHEAVTANNVQKALAELKNYILPALRKNPSLAQEQDKLNVMDSRLSFALTNHPDEESFEGAYGGYLERLAQTTLALKQRIRANEPIPEQLLSEVDDDIEQIYTASIKTVCAAFPTPEHMKAKTAATQELSGDATKELGRPGDDWDSTNYFDNRDLSRKFYSQFDEGAVLIADDGSYYQVVRLVAQAGNFIAMLQDVLYPQIVFTIGATDLMAHTWKWISPFDVVVNPALAPKTTQSVGDIVAVSDIEKPTVPERWLSY